MGEVRNIIQFSELNELLRKTVNTFPDKRRGKNCHYTLEDICLAGFSVFFTQSPSFLAHQKAMKNAKGNSNANSVFHIKEIPTDNHIRNILDDVPPELMHGLFDEIFHRLDKTGILNDFRSFGNEVLLALDGTQYYSSSTVHCDKCSKREHKDGSVTYYHSLLAPAIVSPHHKKAIALAPEFLSSQKNCKKQDHELSAAKRWLSRMGEKLSPYGVTVLGDDLYSRQPFCEELIKEDLNFILVCKPTSHKWLYEWVNTHESEGEVQELIVKKREKNKVRFYNYRFTHDLPLRDTDDALHVNWAEVIVRNEQGRIMYKNAFMTNHLLQKSNIESFIEAGRSRWKIENENNNTLKTKGYHLEHNFGHGQKYLSQTLAVLNIVAFLFHTLLSFSDKRYQLIRKTLPRRDMFFQDIAALFRYMIFRNWDHLLLHMIKSFELEDPG